MWFKLKIPRSKATRSTNRYPWKWYLRYTVPPGKLSVGHLLKKLFSQQIFYQSRKLLEARLIWILTPSGEQCCQEVVRVGWGRPSQRRGPEGPWAAHSQDFVLFFISELKISVFFFFLIFGLWPVPLLCSLKAPTLVPYWNTLLLLLLCFLEKF